MKKFTASEVRDHAIWVGGVAGMGNSKTYTMLRAYADRLEAQERAVPVAYALFTEKGLIRMWSREWFGVTHGTPVNPAPLYTHPAPADAERLAEALRWIMRTAGDAKEPCGGDPESPAAIRNGVLASISQAAAQSLGIVQGPSLAAHSAQAPFDPAKVADHIVDAIIDGLEATGAQAQPPAASVPDVMDDYREGIQQIRAVLAAQENPNG